MTRMRLGDAFLLNPPVKLGKGTVASFVGMDAVAPFTRTVHASTTKPFSGGAKFLPGDVLMARITPSLENGKTSQYRAADGLPASGSTEFIVIRGREGVSDTDFGYYLFTSQCVREYAISQMNGSSGRQRVQTDALEKFEVDLPSLDRQRGIAATLGALDNKIDSNRRAQCLLEELALAHFTYLFSVDLAPCGVAISQLIDVNPRRPLRRGTVATYVGMSSLPENSAEVYDWGSKEFGSGQKFLNGDVLMARITPCLENGKTVVVDMLSESQVGWGSTEYIVLAPKLAISTAWIYCLVRSEHIRSYAIRSMTGTSGRQRFQADGFDKYMIEPPDEISLSRFDALADPLFKRMTSLRDETRRLAALRDTLRPELLSDRVPVPMVVDVVDGIVE
jgi:type I restriction enzyme, S subunit